MLRFIYNNITIFNNIQKDNGDLDYTLNRPSLLK